MIRSLALSTSVFLLPLGACADWTLLEDFESFPDGHDATALFPVEADPASPADVSATIRAEDSSNPASNKGYFLELHANDVGGLAWASIPLGETIPEGQVGTVYFRLRSADYSAIEWLFGFTTRDNGDGSYAEDASDVSTLLRKELGSPFDIGGSELRDAVEIFQPTEDTWTEFWIVIFNGLKPDQRCYRIYARTAGEADPVLLRTQTSGFTIGSSTNSLFMLADPMQALVVGTMSPAPLTVVPGPWLIDDLNIDLTGGNLGDASVGENDPAVVIATWKGYLAEADFDGFQFFVQTGDWIGTVTLTDTPWVYSYRLRHWIWVPDPEIPATDGAWVYVSR